MRSGVDHVRGWRRAGRCHRMRPYAAGRGICVGWILGALYVQRGGRSGEARSVSRLAQRGSTLARRRSPRRMAIGPAISAVKAERLRRATSGSWLLPIRGRPGAALPLLFGAELWDHGRDWVVCVGGLFHWRWKAPSPSSLSRAPRGLDVLRPARRRVHTLPPSPALRSAIPRCSSGWTPPPPPVLGYS
jgi:hypothetical protein